VGGWEGGEKSILDCKKIKGKEERIKKKETNASERVIYPVCVCERERKRKGERDRLREHVFVCARARAR